MGDELIMDVRVAFDRKVELIRFRPDGSNVVKFKVVLTAEATGEVVKESTFGCKRRATKAVANFMNIEIE